MNKTAKQNNNGKRSQCCLDLFEFSHHGLPTNMSSSPPSQSTPSQHIIGNVECFNSLVSAEAILSATSSVKLFGSRSSAPVWELIHCSQIPYLVERRQIK